MAPYNLTSPKTGKVYSVNFEGEPTDQAMKDAVDQFDAQFAPQGVVPPETEKQIREQAAQGVGSKLFGAFKMPFEMGADVVRNLGGGAGEAFQTVEQAAQSPSLEEKLNILLRIPRAGVEAGGRVGFDVLSLLKQGGGAILDNPMLLTPKGQGEAIFNYLQPKQLTDQEVEQAFQNQLEAKAFGEVRGGGDRGKGTVPEAGMGTLPEFLTNLIGPNELPALSESVSQLANLETPATALATLGATKIPSATRRLLGRPKSMLADALDFSNSDINKIDRLKSGLYTGLLPEIKANYRGPLESALTNRGATDAFLEAGSKTLKQRGEIFAPTVKKADAAKYFGDKNAILSQWDQNLAESVSTPEIRARLLADKDLVANLNSLTPENLLQRAHELNDDLINFYKKPNPAMSADTVLAKEALRDTYSGLVKTILDDAKIDPRVYSEYGAIREMTDQIGKNNSLNWYKQEKLKGQGSAQRFLENTSAGKLFGGVQALTDKFTGGEVSRMNKQINTLMRDTPAVKPNFKKPVTLGELSLKDKALQLAADEATQADADQLRGASMRQGINETLQKVLKDAEANRSAVEGKNSALAKQIEEQTATQSEADTFRGASMRQGLNDLLGNITREAEANRASVQGKNSALAKQIEEQTAVQSEADTFRGAAIRQKTGQTLDYVKRVDQAKVIQDQLEKGRAELEATFKRLSESAQNDRAASNIAMEHTKAQKAMKEFEKAAKELENKKLSQQEFESKLKTLTQNIQDERFGDKLQSDKFKEIMNLGLDILQQNLE